MWNPGQARHQIAIEQCPPGVDSMGDASPPATGYLPVATCWAIVSPLVGMQAKAAQQIYGKVPTKFTIRYRPGINPDRMRIRWGMRVFRIVSAVDPMEGHVEIQIEGIEMPREMVI